MTAIEIMLLVLKVLPPFYSKKDFNRFEATYGLSVHSR